MAKSIGDPEKLTGPGKASAMVDPASIRKTGPLDDKFDVRDILANFVSRGDKDLSGDQAKKDYHYMSSTLGEPMARKMLNHVLIFNQRPDQQNQSFEKKLSSLYTIGSNDKDVDGILKKTNMLDKGAIAGARESGNVGSMMAAGTLAPDLTKSTAMSNKSILR